MHADKIDKHRSRIQTIIYLSYASLLLWMPLFFLSFMIMSAPNVSRVWVWLLVIIIWALPVAIFLVPRFAKRALNNGQVKTAYCLVGISPGIIILPELFSVAVMIYGIFR